MNPMNATAEFTPATNEELAQIEGGVTGQDSGCIPDGTMKAFALLQHVPITQLLNAPQDPFSPPHIG